MDCSESGVGKSVVYEEIMLARYFCLWCAHMYIYVCTVRGSVIVPDNDNDDRCVVAHIISLCMMTDEWVH